MTTTPGPPVAPRRPVVRTAHGVRRVDDHAWLARAGDPEVLAHLAAERAHYDRTTAHLEHLRAELTDEMVRRTPAADSSVRWRRGECVYYTETLPGQEYPRLVRVGPGDDARPQVVLDPNEVARATGSDYVGTALAEPSPDGRLLAWSVDLTGEELYTLRFRDLATGEDLPDEVPRTYYGGAWSADGAHFVYTVPDERYRPSRVRRHALGTRAEDDVELWHEDDERYELEVAASRDGGWVVLTAACRDTTEVRLLDAHDVGAPPRLVAARRPGVEYRVSPLPGGWDGTGEDALLLVTDDGAPEFRAVLAPVPAPGGAGDPATWRPLPAAPPAAGERLVAAEAFAGHVVLVLRAGFEQRLRVLPRRPGGRVLEVPGTRPAGCLALGRNESWDADGVVVVDEDLVTPPRWSLVDLSTGDRTVLKETAVPGVDLDAYATTRIEATAPDGTAVPVTVAHRRDVVPDGTVPALLYGYGAYEACSWPQFEVPVLSLLDRGVTYAVAHVRGGGEGGRGWWQQGRLLAKQNTFTDFVAARDGLVASGWARADAVASRGLSAGGLLQGAAYTQAPDRWRAVLAEVPFVDVVTTMSDASIPLTVNEWDEWGDPVTRADHFAAMLAWSPYDHVDDVAAALERDGRLPDLLVTGAVHDPRVLVHEPAKWTAALRARLPGGAPSGVLFRVETGEGAHGGPSGRLAALGYEAEVLAWVLDRLGVR